MSFDEEGFYLTETEKYLGIAAVLLVILGVATYIIFFSGWAFGVNDRPTVQTIDNTTMNVTMNATTSVATATAKATVRPTVVPTPAPVVVVTPTPLPPAPTPVPPAPQPSPSPIPVQPTPVPPATIKTVTTISGGSGTFTSGQVLTIHVTVTPGASTAQKGPGNVGLYVDNQWAALMTQTDATHYTAYLPVATSVYPSGTQHFMTAQFSGDYGSGGISEGRLGSEATSFFTVV